MDPQSMEIQRQKKKSAFSSVKLPSINGDY